MAKVTFVARPIPAAITDLVFCVAVPLEHAIGESTALVALAEGTEDDFAIDVFGLRA